ncbi:MAG: TolC family protein [Flavobacterium sp.]|nr:MAG: TolC family protein [Flavobacterium sp.]
MFPKSIICLWCLFIFVPGRSLLAQDSTASSLKWNLQTCLTYAQKNNIQINSLRLSEKTSRQELLLSRSALLPNLYGSVSQVVTRGNNFNTSVGAYQSGITPTGSYGVTSAWTLYQGGYLRSDIQQKNLSVESANLNVLEQENSIILSITQSYLNILLDKESVIYQQNVFETSKAQVTQAQQRFNLGSVARKDVAQLQSQQANDQYTLVTYQNTERQDLLTLKQLLQLPTDASFDIVKPDTVIAGGTITPVNETQRIALQNRPEVKNSQLGVDISRIGLAKARSGYLPALSASGSLFSSYSNSNSNYFTQLNNNFYQQVGVTLSVPIFTRRSSAKTFRSAKLRRWSSNITNRKSRSRQ